MVPNASELGAPTSYKPLPFWLWAWACDLLWPMRHPQTWWFWRLKSDLLIGACALRKFLMWRSTMEERLNQKKCSPASAKPILWSTLQLNAISRVITEEISRRDSHIYRVVRNNSLCCFKSLSLGWFLVAKITNKFRMFWTPLAPNNALHPSWDP